MAAVLSNFVDFANKMSNFSANIGHGTTQFHNSFAWNIFCTLMGHKTQTGRYFLKIPNPRKSFPQLTSISSLFRGSLQALVKHMQCFCAVSDFTRLQVNAHESTLRTEQVLVVRYVLITSLTLVRLEIHRDICQ